MKILHVDTGTTWRGGQAQIYNLITHFPGKEVQGTRCKEQGKNNRPTTNSQNPNTASSTQSPEEAQETDLENHLLCPPNSPLLVRFENFSTSSPVPQFPSSQGPTLHTHPLRGAWDLSAVWKVGKLHRKYNFDLIHAHSSGALGITWATSLLFNLPPFIETRRLETTVAHNVLSKMKYRATHHHIANSETVKEGLLKSGIDEEKITVIPSGINLEKIEGAEPNPSHLREIGFDPDRPVIGNVGALCPQKDQKTFVEAANLVLKDHPKVQFVIAGEGELRRELEDQIEELGLTENVKLAGFVKDIFGLMKTFDIFILSSRYEGLCGTLLQAMACHRPIISTNVEGSQQILEHEKTSLVAPKGDHEKIASYIKNILQSPENYQSMIQEGYSTAKEYDYNSLSTRTKKFYFSLLNDDSNEF